nr:MFS transporter [Caballeronia sp. GAWG2-1]
MFGFLLCFLDRINVGMAALTMNADLGLSPAAFGFGVGLFFWGYCSSEILSSMALGKFGARKWLARIMVVWGAASLAMAWVSTPTQFYVLRFLLGMAEAGFVPGTLYFFRGWFPRRYYNGMVGLFLVSNPLASLIGNPLSGLIMEHLNGALALKGWQWLFIVESIPTILLGIVVFFVLPDRPSEVSWLEPAEKQWLVTTIAEERTGLKISDSSVFRILTNWRIWLVSLVNHVFVVGIYGVTFFLPQIVKDFGLSTTQVGFVSAIPSLFGAAAIVVLSRNSDRTGERAWHNVFCAVLAIVGLLLTAYAPTPLLKMVGLTVAAMGVLAGNVVFWGMPNALIGGAQAAAAFGLINTIGSFGGVVGPNIMGLLREATGSFRSGLIGLAVCQILAIVIALYFRKEVNVRDDSSHSEDTPSTRARRMTATR